MEVGKGTEKTSIYDNVSAITAICEPQCYEKSDGSHDARSGLLDIPNEPSYQ